MSLRFRRLGGLMSPTGFLVAALLAAIPCGAQNLITNPTFDEPLDPWTLDPSTSVRRFLDEGGVALTTTNVGGGGISQCIDISTPPPGTQLEGSFEGRIPAGAKGGGIIGILSAYTLAGCTGDVIESTRFEPEVNQDSYPDDTMVALSALSLAPPGAKSLVVQALLFTRDPTEPFPIELLIASLELLPPPPGGEPDLEIEKSFFVDQTRIGPDTIGFGISIKNTGNAPSTGPWTVTIKVPQGVGLGCGIGSPGECTGTGTRELTITGTNEIPAGGMTDTILVVVRLQGVEAGNYSIESVVSGGGEMDTSNNALMLGLGIAEGREGTRVPDDQPQTTTGRGRP